MIAPRNRTVSGDGIIILLFDMDVSIHPGHRDFTWATHMNRIGLEVVGLWPKTNGKYKASLASDLRMGIIFVLINILTLIPLLCSLQRVWGDMTLMIDNLEVTLGMTIVSMKLIIMRWKRAAVASILKMMLEDWIELTADTEKSIMVRRLQTARTITICSYILMVLAFTVTAVLPSFGIPFRHFSNLTDGNRLLPLQGYYFYDTDKSPLFELILIVQSMSIFIACIVFASVDMFLGLCIFHICGQLKIFRRRLVNWVPSADFESDLSKHVQLHRRLIRFAENMEDAFSLLMLGLLTYFIVVFCLFTFLFLTMTTDNATGNASLLIKVCGLVCALILFTHTLLYCGGGEIILHHYEEVYRAVFDFEWYKLDSRRARSLMILMIRIKEPTRITAGKVVPLTLATFCSLLKTSAGYISFLLAMRD